MNTASQLSPRTVKWRDICRRAVGRQQNALAEYRGTAKSQVIATSGAGGDATLQIDRDFERLIIDEIHRAFPDADSKLHIVSEEIGSLGVTASTKMRVIIDPVDGSKNAAQGLPQFSLSVAVSDGPSMNSVWFGYVYDFGTNEEFVADDNGHIEHNGVQIDVRSTSPYRVIGFESAEPVLLVPALTILSSKNVQEIRVVGSIAIALCYVALGRLDGLLTCKECRSVDAAAGQLIARQAGCEVLFNGHPPASAALELSALYRLVAGSESVCTYLLEAQQAVPLIPR